MAASKLSLFNGSQLLLRDRLLTQSEVAGLTREPARILQAIWDSGVVRECLALAQWKFATRTVQALASPSVEPDFGYQYAFDKPTDWVRTTGVWSDENMSQPLREYRDEAGFLFSARETLIWSYISDAQEYGGDMARWPENFCRCVEAHMAWRAAGPLTDRGNEMFQVRKYWLEEAGGVDAMSDPSKRMPLGSWNQARFGGGSFTRRRG